MPSALRIHFASSRISIPGLIVLLVAALVSGACQGAGDNAGNRQAARGVPVKQGKPQRVTVQREVDLAGTLTSPDQARVSSEAAGVIRQVMVELGTEVRAGDPLVRLDPRESQLAVERAESALRQTEAQLGMGNGSEATAEQVAAVRTAEANRADARSAYERAQRLVERGLLAPVELQNAETRLKVAEAAYQSAVDSTKSVRAGLQDRRASLALARKKLDDAVIRAPFAGLVSERLVQAGEMIRENTPVATIVQVDPLKLRTAVQEKFAALITPGLGVRFRVESMPGDDFRGKVAFVSPAVDPATRTFSVEAVVENKDRRLKPGFFAKGVIETGRDENVLAVPADAISTLAGVSNVFVIENGVVRQQAVKVGVSRDGLVEVVEGLEGEETLALTNLGQLASGVAVTDEQAPQAAGQGGKGGAGQGSGDAAKGGRP
jgi:membrane fusion protein (multidrug efflux system)